MYKYFLIGLILTALNWNAVAQDRKTLAAEITNRMSFMKKGNEKRQIECRDDSIYGTPFSKVISPKNISKDSLRHLLVDNGFYDFNFESFSLKIKKIDELDETFVENHTPLFVGLLSDSSYNKITYSFQKATDGIKLFFILSKNDVIIDKEKELFYAITDGGVIYNVTFKGCSKIPNISYWEDDSFSNLNEKKTNNGNNIKLDEKNQFKITVDVHSRLNKYIGIQDSTGEILSIIKP